MPAISHAPRRRFGQHFLHDPRVIDRIVASIDPHPDQTLVEIGPGLGAITVPLLERIPHLHVVEIDRDLVERLRAIHPRERMTIHPADVLKFDFNTLPAPVRIVGNLPYNVSTPLLFHLMDFADRITDCHFMLQREVVERMVAKADTPQYGRLSVMLQVRFAMVSLFGVSRGAFNPPPKVESAIVRMVPDRTRWLDDETFIYLGRVVTQAFTQRRKMLRNGLAGLFTEAELAGHGIDARLRPEALSVEQFLILARAVRSREAPVGGRAPAP